MMVKGDQPAIEARALQGLGITDRLELTAGRFGSTYQGSQARPLDLLIQPKYVLHNPLGAIPSISVAAASLFPLSNAHSSSERWEGLLMREVVRCSADASSAISCYTRWRRAGMRSRNTESFKKRLALTRKPQVKFLSCQSNSLNFKAQKGYQRRLDPLPSTKPHFVRAARCSFIVARG